MQGTKGGLQGDEACTRERKTRHTAATQQRHCGWWPRWRRGGRRGGGGDTGGSGDGSVGGSGGGGGGDDGGAAPSRLHRHTRGLANGEVQQHHEQPGNGRGGATGTRDGGWRPVAGDASAARRTVPSDRCVA